MFICVPVYLYHEQCTRHDCWVVFKIMSHWFDSDWDFKAALWILQTNINVLLCPNSLQVGMFGARQVVELNLAGVNTCYSTYNEDLAWCWIGALFILGFFPLCQFMYIANSVQSCRCSPGNTTIFSWSNMKHTICQHIIRLPNKTHGKLFKGTQIPFSERLWSFRLMKS